MCSRSACSGFVGIPVEGPARIASSSTSGVSVISARPSGSLISAKPPPDDPDIAFTPVCEAPTASAAAAISSSTCSEMPPMSGRRFVMMVNTSVHGVIGYPAMNRQPASMDAYAMPWLPETSTCSSSCSPSGTRRSWENSISLTWS